MDEKIVYTSQLKGVIFRPLPLNDTFINALIVRVTSQTLNEQEYWAIYQQIILYFGVLLENEEEQELLENIQKENTKNIHSLLLYIKKIYPDYFLEQLSSRREQVEIVYREIRERNIFIEDSEISEIKKAESTQNFELGKFIFQKIIADDERAIVSLYTETMPQSTAYLLKNSGNGEDAKDHWNDCFLEFRAKLKLKPDTVGYYAWRKKGSNTDREAILSTFFIGICKKRWIDKLRKRKGFDTGAIELHFASETNQYEFDDYESKQILLDTLRYAIGKLSKTCQNIIVGKWLDELKSKELEKKIGLSAGYIDNQHRGCFEQLKTMVLKKGNQ